MATVSQAADSPPSGVSEEQSPYGLRVRCSWFSMWAVGNTVAVVFIAGVLVKAGWPIRQMLATEHLAVLAGAACVMAYFCLVKMINGTTIALSQEEIRVTHGPLPWEFGRRIATRELSELRVLESAKRLKYLGKVMQYDVFAVLKNGRHVKLISGLHDGDRAHFVKRAIDQHAGLEVGHSS